MVEHWLNDLENGAPRVRYQARMHLSGLNKKPGSQLVDIYNRSQIAEVKVAVLEILSRARLNASTTALVIRGLSEKNHQIRRAAAEALLYASPRIKRYRALINRLSISEKDEPTRAILLKLSER